MAGKEYHFFSGKGKWVRTTAPDPWGNWKTDLYFNQESLDRYRQLHAEKGLMNRINKDDDGYYVTFKRPIEKQRRDGKKFGFAPPEVLHSDGTTPLRDTLVGNGSDITVKIELYNYNKPGGGKGYATRLEAIRVDNLIPFDGKRDFEKDQEKQVRGLDEQPSQEVLF